MGDCVVHGSDWDTCVTQASTAQEALWRAGREEAEVDGEHC